MEIKQIDTLIYTRLLFMPIEKNVIDFVLQSSQRTNFELVLLRNGESF